MWRTRLKIPVAMTTGAIITIGLFGVMNFLISAGPGAMGSSATNPAIRFAAITLEPAPPPKVRAMPKRPEPTKELPRPVNPVSTKIDPPVSQPTSDFQGLDIPLASNGQNWTAMCGHYPSGCSGQGQDGDIVALARIQPIYPRRPALMGVEGFVTVEFTITAAGTVIDARVVDAKPRRVFELAALRAIVKWKFKPRYVNGQAVARRVTQTLDFRLD